MSGRRLISIGRVQAEPAGRAGGVALQPQGVLQLGALDVAGVRADVPQGVGRLRLQGRQRQRHGELTRRTPLPEPHGSQSVVN